MEAGKRRRRIHRAPQQGLKGVPVRGAPRKLQSPDFSRGDLGRSALKDDVLGGRYGYRPGLHRLWHNRQEVDLQKPFSRLAPLVWTWSASWKLRSKFRSGRGGTHRHQLLGGRRVHGDRRVKVRLGRAHRHRDRDELDHFGRLMRKEMRADDPLRHAVDDQLS